MKKIGFTFALLFLLAACSSDEPPRAKLQAPPSTTINLDVLTVTVVDRSTPALADSPMAKYNFQPTIASSLHQWLQGHLKAAGTSGSAEVVITDASLGSQALPHKNDMFTREQASKYTAHASVDIVIHGHEGSGQVSAEASRFETLPEKPTAIERQNAYTHVLNGLMHDLGINLDTAIRQHIGDFIITAPILNDQGH